MLKIENVTKKWRALKKDGVITRPQNTAEITAYAISVPNPNSVPKLNHKPNRTLTPCVNSLYGAMIVRRDVNETLGSETETRPRRLTYGPRRDRDRDLPTLCRDRDETETETLRGRDRDVFRDVGTLGYLK